MYRITFVFLVLCIMACSEKRRLTASEKNVATIKKILEESEGSEISRTAKLRLIDSAQRLITTYPKDSIYNQLAIEIASSYYAVRNWNGYKDITTKFLENSKKIGDSNSVAKAYYNRGLIKNHYREYDSAYYYFYNSNKLYSLLENDYRVGRTYIGMAMIQKRNGDLIGAEATFINAIEALKKINDVEFSSESYNSLGNIRRTVKDYNQAIKYHQLYLELSSTLDDELEMATPYNNLGWDYEKQGDYNKAEELYKKGLALENLKLHNYGIYGILIDNLAHVQFNQGRYENLPSPYYEALEVADSLNNLNLAISANLNLSEYYHFSGDKGKALEFAKRAYVIEQNNNYTEKAPMILRHLISISNETEKIKYATKYINLTDSLQLAERRSRDQFARIRFRSDELEAETISLQIENEKSEARSRLLLSITVGTILVGLLLFVIKRQQDSKRKLLVEQKQQKANEEIYQLMLNQQTKLNEGRSMERKRFSKELHDGVLSRLFGVRLSLESMNLNGQNSTKELYVNELQGIEKEIRQISHDLGSDIFEGKQDFVTVVEDLLIRQSSITAWTYDLINDEHIDWDTVSSPHKIHMYRVIQESIQNINKYAKASLVTVSFKLEESEIAITINDNGKGFDIKEINKHKGIGLKNMYSRAKEINAEIEITSAENTGTSITIKGIKTSRATIANG